MKSIPNKILLFCIALSIFSCKKDEVKTVLTSGTAPVLSASQITLVLTAATAADTVEVFSGTRLDYGYKAAAKYILQFAKGGTNFASPKEVSMTNNIVTKYSGAALNQLVNLMGFAPGNAGQLEARIKSSISDSVPPLYSNVVKLTITPYTVIINYPSLWVPGDYQGWNAATAPKISSKNSNGIYEGYVNIVGGTRQFKYTSDPDWTHLTYGWASSVSAGNDVSGTFSSSSNGNLFVPADGYYLLKGNTNNNSWSATKTTWAIIGDAPTLSNNWATDVPMVYDVANNVWKVTTNLVAGKFKFHANGAWAISYGDTGADFSLEFEGADIIVPASLAGSRTITLSFSPGNYTYSIK